MLGLVAMVLAAVGGSLELLEVTFGTSLVGGASGVVLGLLAVLFGVGGHGADEAGRRVLVLGRVAGIAGVVLGLLTLALFLWNIFRIARIT